MKFYFDVRETHTKTIAIEADNLADAEKRVHNAYQYREFEIDYDIADDVQFICVEEDDIFEEENVEHFDCHNVIYDEDDDSYVCPICSTYICCGDTIKDMDCSLPSYCETCGAKLHY